MSDLHDLVAAYVLDALDGQERATFEEHLATCSPCRLELASLASATSAVADDLNVDPPSRLRVAVMDAVERTAQTGTPDDRLVELAEHRAARYRILAVRLGAAAAVAVAVALVSLLGIGRNTLADDIVAAPDVVTISMEGDIGSARFTYSTSVGGGLFVSASLPLLDGDQTYQLWLIDDAGPAPAGLFVPQPNGSVAFLVDDLEKGQVLGLTVEPAGGSPSPTGEVILASELD